jgi:Leucine-rich repeat (LRR) protein
MINLLITLVIVAGLFFGAWFFYGDNGAGTGTISDPKVQKGLDIIKNKDINQNSSLVLDLSGKGLTSLPSEIGNYSYIYELNVSNNSLTGALPAEIRKMQDLRVLNASHNKLTGIPAEIGQLKSLEEADFSYNQIDTMPNEIENIKGNLKVLNLTGNTYTQEAINNIKAKLPNTQVVY